MDQSPDTSRRLTDEQKIQLIDSMRNKGSYEAARERLTATARIIADRVSAAIPGQTWKFDDDPNIQQSDRNGALCDKLTADIARRPIANSVMFGATFSAEDFKIAANIVREEAAKYGATTESSLFNESAKRDYDVQGNGYEFNSCKSNSPHLTSPATVFCCRRCSTCRPDNSPRNHPSGQRPRRHIDRTTTDSPNAPTVAAHRRADHDRHINRPDRWLHNGSKP
ncbi:lipoprotein LppA [Mycobacterium tuberculosis]|nr:lipoprotein LppA [Mycobacterium tuberculosis]